MEAVSINDAIRFIREHNVLATWTDEDICLGIKKAIHENALAFELGYNDKILSLVFGRWSGNNLHVIAAAGHGRLSNMIQHLTVTFPDCKYITAYRDNKYITYKVSKLKSLLK